MKTEFERLLDLVAQQNELIINAMSRIVALEKCVSTLQDGEISRLKAELSKARSFEQEAPND